MKVLAVFSAWYPHYTSASVGIILDQVNHYLSKKGIMVDICTPIGGNIKVINTPLLKYMRTVGPIDHFIRRIYFWKKALSFIKQHYDTYDLFWVHNPNPFIWRNANKNIFNKVIITQHSTFTGVSEKSPYKSLKLKIYFYFMKRFEKQFFNTIKNLSNKIIVISPYITKELVTLGIKKERIVYIPNGVDTQKFKPVSDKEKRKLREKFNIPEDKIVMLNIGQLIESKHPVEMIKLFKKLKSTYKDLYLIVVGKGRLLLQIKKMIEEIDDTRLIEYTPHHELCNLYKCSDYYITASTYEGQSLALLEAMSSGLACITSKIPNLESIIKEADCGISINFENMEEAYMRLSEFLDKGNIIYLGKNAREYIEKNHDWKFIANNNYIKEFDRVTCKKEECKK